ncbi:uncharacterized protein JCM6883_003800 [Sporobolomyces salmoneus]|uniref:uncharacterized protein n=1 Tax=Sporobolomyces salmoneus TaxID=183962 RepID=UPI0031723BC3
MSEHGSESTILVVPIAPLSVVDAKFFIDKLKSYSGDAPNPERSSGAEDLPHLTSPWSIRNKYYSANVQFRILPLADAEGAQVAVAGDGDEPAIVVLVPSQAMPPAPAKQLLETLSKRIPEFDVSLLVTLPPQPSTPTTVTGSSQAFRMTNRVTEKPDEEAWDDLALDNGFEWIDLSSGFDDGTSDQALEDDHGEGLGRIRDALESHMWEGMVRNTDPDPAKLRRNRGNDVGLEAEEDDTEEEEDFTSLGVPPLPEPRPFVPTKLEFPATFLPSIPRKSTNNASPLSTATSDSASRIPQSEPAPLRQEEESFEDDFSPFVEASTSSLATSFLDPFPPSSTSRSPPLCDTNDERKSDKDDSTNELEEADEKDLDSLEDMFEQIRLAREGVLREEEGSTGLEVDEETMLKRRRERAERLMEQMLGAGGMGL